MQIALTTPIPGRYQVDLQAALVRGHEAAIRLVDARGNYVCLCCPAPLLNNGMFKTGPEFHNVLCHIYGKQHAACAARWVKVKYLMLCLHLFARVAGRVLLWHARAAERVYAPAMLRAASASKKPRRTSRHTRALACECMSDRSVSCV